MLTFVSLRHTYLFLAMNYSDNCNAWVPLQTGLKTLTHTPLFIYTYTHLLFNVIEYGWAIGLIG